MVQSEDNLKIIRKYDKNNLINNFLEKVYLADVTPLSKNCDDFLCFLVAQKWWKANITLKHSIISKAQLKS